jgi:hypothetical protein
MPNTNSRYNPAYSTVKSITLVSSTSSRSNTDLNVVRQNTQCRFERIEFVENVNDVFPSGSLVVTDLQDIVSYIGYNNIQKLIVEFFNGKKWYCDVTSVSYVNNAASDTDDTIVAINFTNSYYEYFSSNSLNALLGYKKPLVFSIDEFVTLLRTWTFGNGNGYQDLAKNYFLYKPLIPFNEREETLPDNAIEMMNYLATGAIDSNNNPNFLFWTSFGGDVNFKSFKRDITKDSSYASINADYRNIAVYDGDSVLQKLSDDKVYRKAYFFATNPAYQWISKNYYYIRKTPKYLDTLPAITIPAGLTGDAKSEAEANALIATQNAAIKNLAFHFQDEGQKFNIDVVTVNGRGTNAPPGGDQIFPEHSWGYFDGEYPTNRKSITNMLGNQYGTENSYKSLSLMGQNGYMPFLDSPDMWKNMFDLTPIHPHYPDEKGLTGTMPGDDTHLQKIMDVRYNTFMGSSGASGASGASGGTGSTNSLEKLRSIEAQNFVMYSLCCMGKKEDCFFAVLQRYEPDNAYYGVSGASGSSEPEFSNGAKYYRYKWNKIIFNGNSGASGGSGSSGGSQGTIGSSFTGGGNSGPSGSSGYNAHQLELWGLDPVIKSETTQDDTWAINLNERGLTKGYLPPGWIASNSSSFKFRPIGASGGSFQSSANIFHIARVCIEQIDANNSVTYFWAENVLDGNC